MPLFEVTIPIDHAVVAGIVAENWGVKLGKCIKASQNHTFIATDESTGNEFIVRVTPDAENVHFQQFQNEMFLINYLGEAGLDVSCPLPSKLSENKFVIRAGNLTISMFHFANGKSLPYPELKWMTEKKVVVATGRWLGKFHTLSKQFALDHPEVTNRMRLWNTIHDGVMKDIVIDEKDKVTEDNPDKWGILHGDLNPSNWFYNEDKDTLSVFDWDQCQQGWFMLDVAQCCHAPVSMKAHGMAVSGTPVPEANPDQYIGWITEGYESEAGEGSLDREELDRMLNYRKEFYYLFCTRAQNETIPPDIKPFIDFVYAQAQKEKNK